MPAQPIRSDPEFRASVTLGLALSAWVVFGTTSPRAFAEGYDRPSRRPSSSSIAAGSATTDLSVAAAVAAPSSGGFIGENPAGLIYNTSPFIQAFLASDDDFPGLLSNGISAGAGNGLATALVGVQSFSNATDDRGSITRLNFGVATYVEALGTVFGLNGAYRFTSKAAGARDPGLEPTWTANLGMLFNASGTFRFGLNFYELNKGMTGFAAGVSTMMNSASVVSIDAGTDNSGRGLTIKPGIGVRAASLLLTYAYGMQVDDTVRSNIPPGNTLGLGFQASDSVYIVGYYNHFELYSVAGKVSF